MEDSYYKRNRERLLARAKQYREDHKDEYNAKYKIWYQTNKVELYQRRKAKLALKPKPIRIPKPQPVVEPKPLIPISIPEPPRSNVEIIDREILVRFD